MLTSGKLVGLTAELRTLAKADIVVTAHEPTSASPLLLKTNKDQSTAPASTTTLSPAPPPSTLARRTAGIPHVLLLRVDPSLLLRKGDTTIEPRLETTDASVEAIESCFSDRSLDQDERWAALPSFAAKEDMDEAKRLCRLINPAEWARVFVAFADVLVDAQKERSKTIRARDAELSKNWAEEPWYQFDPKYFNIPAASATSTATFDDAGRGLEYLRRLGFENIALLPHYESDGLGGSGVVANFPSRQLGGTNSWSRFLQRSSQLGVRVLTAAPITETSIHHKWFERAIDGDKTHLEYYRRTNGSKKLGVSARDGELYARYLLREGVVIEEVLLHPEITPHDHRLLADIDGAKEEFWHRRFPWEVELDLTNPAVLREIFVLLAAESNSGVLGRMFEGACAEEVSALLELFLRLLSPRSTWIALDGGSKPWERGEVALRESLVLEDREPLEKALEELKELDLPNMPLAWLENFREFDLCLTTSTETRAALVDAALKRGGELGRAGAALASRIADLLDGEPQRIALGLFCLYMLPVTPVVYFGTELGRENDRAHAETIRKLREHYLGALDSKIASGTTHDPSLMLRGGISETATKERHAAAELLAKLNLLRKKSPAFAGREVTKLESTHKGALVWIKSNGTEKILLVANLTARTARIALTVSELKKYFGTHQLATLLGPASAVRHGAGRVFITLPPHGTLALARE